MRSGVWMPILFILRSRVAQVRLEAVSLDKNGEVLFAAMPELLTLILLGIGLEGLARFRRKFKKS